MTTSLLERLFTPGTIERLGWMLVHVLWQAAAVAILLAVFLRLLRNTGANIRYGAACSALALMIALPLATMHYIRTPGPVAEAGPAFAAADLPTMPAPTPDDPLADSKHAGRVEYWNDGIMGEQLADSPPFHPSPVPLPERITSALEPALPYMVLGWLIGVFGLSAWHLGGWTQLQRLKRRMVREIGAPLQRRLEEISDRLGLHRAVGLLESALVEVPTVVGWLRPVILLPASALTGLRPEQLEAILAHELAHIRRYDYLVNMLQTVVEILGFYHPAIWWVSHRVRIERENCCDDLAVYVCGSSLQYAKALACMEEIRHGGTDLAVAATGGSLMARIARLLGRPAVEDRRFAWLPGLITLLLVIGIVIPAAFTLGAGNPPQSSADTGESFQALRQEREAQAASARPSPGAAAGQADREGTDPARADTEAGNTPDQTRQVLLEFRIFTALDDRRPDRAALQQLAQVLGDQSPLARALRQRGPMLDLTLGEVFKRYIVPQSLSEPAGAALIRLLQSQSGTGMLSAPRLLARDGVQADIRIAGEHFPAGSDPSAKPQRIEYGTVMRATPHVLDADWVSLEMLAEVSDLVPGSDPNQPAVWRTSAEANVTARNNRYLIWAAAQSVAGPANQGQGAESLYIMVKPVILPPVPGYAGPAAAPESTETPPPQVLLDVRTVTMERGALLNLGVEWAWPTVKAGAFPPPAAGNATSPSRGNDWPDGVQIGYTADRTFTNALLTALDLLRENGQARVSSQQILAQDGHQSRIKALTEEWYTVTAQATKPSPQSPPEPHKMESGTVVTITPRLGDNGKITLEAAIEVSTSLPHTGSTLPLVTRRTAKNAVTIRDGGTVAVAGMTAYPARPNDRSAPETAIFVTAHQIQDVNEAALPAPPSAEAPTRVPPAGPVSPEQQMLLRQEYVNSDPMVCELSRRIVEAEQELIVLRQKFTSSHPTVVQKNALLESYRQKLDQKRTELQEEYDRGLAERLRTATDQRSKEATVTATFPNTDLLSALAEMSQRTGVKITPDLTAKTMPITVELAEAPLETALLRALKNTPYTFRKLEDGTYLVFRPLSFPFPQVELIQALQDLSTAAGVPIVADPNVTGPVNVTFADVSLEEALQMLLAGKPYVYKRMPRYYLVADRSGTLPPPETVETRRIRLNYAQPAQAKQLLSPVFAPYVQVDPSRTQDANDEGNTLTITAAPALIDRIVEDLKQIDRFRQQVLLEARVVVLEPNELQNLGLEWSRPPVRSMTSSPSTPPKTIVPIASTPDRAATGSLMMALNLLQENHRADIIANPKLVAQDGRQAQMKMIQEEWLGRTSPANDSFITRAELSKIESGTVMTITPRVGDNNDIMLEMAVEISESIPKARGSDLPLIARRTVKNAVTVKDGGTVAVAGLTQNRSKDGEKRVPVLADIPLLGELFRNRNNDKAGREVAVFVTAHLVPDAAGMTSPAPESSATVIRIPPPTGESVPLPPGPDRSEAPVPAANQEQVKPSVLIDARFVSADERLLRDLRGRGAIRGVTSPQETEALHEIGRRLSEGKSLVLTAEQAGLLMKAAQQYRDCHTLAAPQAVARESEPLSFWIGSKIPYTAGYEEPNEPAGTPKPRRATLDTGLMFETTARLVGQDGVKLDGTLRLTTLLGFDKKKYKGRYRYRVPRTEDVAFSLDNPVVPSGGTSLALGPKARRNASDKPQPILILVTPSLVEAKTSPEAADTVARPPDSRAWSILRQSNAPPLLLGLTQQLLKVLQPSRQNDALWQEVAGGGSLKLDVKVERETGREIVVGLFRDAKWSQEPVAVRLLPREGTYTLTGLPAGQYQIGAMIGRAPSAAALGVQRTWPEAIEIRPGRTTEARLLVALDFAFNASGWYNREVSRDYIGDWNLLKADHLLQGRLTGPDGAPIPFGRVGVREYQAVRTDSFAAPDLGTNEAGLYKFDGMKWPYRVGATWSDTLPDLLGCRYQHKSFHRVFEGPQEVDFRFDPFPAGTARMAGRVVDEQGAAVTMFRLRVRTLASSRPGQTGGSPDPDGGISTTYEYTVPFLSADGSFALGDLPAGRVAVNALSFDYRPHRPEKEKEVVLVADKTTEIQFEMVHNKLFYGRVLFEDGRPAVVTPAPWEGAKTTLRIDETTLFGRAIGHSIHEVAEADAEGWFAVYFLDRELQNLQSGSAKLRIRLPGQRQDEWQSGGAFPFEKLAQDKAQAGAVTIPPGPKA